MAFAYTIRSIFWKRSRGLPSKHSKNFYVGLYIWSFSLRPTVYVDSRFAGYVTASPCCIASQARQSDHLCARWSQPCSWGRWERPSSDCGRLWSDETCNEMHFELFRSRWRSSIGMVRMQIAATSIDICNLCHEIATLTCQQSSRQKTRIRSYQVTHNK